MPVPVVLVFRKVERGLGQPVAAEHGVFFIRQAKEGDLANKVVLGCEVTGKKAWICGEVVRLDLRPGEGVPLCEVEIRLAGVDPFVQVLGAEGALLVRPLARGAELGLHLFGVDGNAPVRVCFLQGVDGIPWVSGIDRPDDAERRFILESRGALQNALAGFPVLPAWPGDI